MNIVQHRLADKYIIPLAPLFEGKSVLDWGCGDGYAAHLFKVHGAGYVDAYDPYAVPADEYIGDIYTFANDILCLPDRSYDIIWTHHAIEHITFIGETFDLIKKYGTELWLGCPNTAYKGVYSPGHINNFTVISLLAHLQKHGYGVSEARWWLEENQIRLRLPTSGEVEWPQPIMEELNETGRCEESRLPRKYRW